MRKLPNIHPGEVLLQEFLIPLGISQNALARSIGVPPRRINEIVLGKRRLLPIPLFGWRTISKRRSSSGRRCRRASISRRRGRSLGPA
jgi:hypothetical protein